MLPPPWHAPMKISVSLTEADIAVLDRYADAAGLASRSAALQAAIRRLGDPAPESAYAEAWGDWSSSGQAAEWETTVADGVDGVDGVPR